MDAASGNGCVEVDIVEAQRNLPSYLRRVEDGQAVVITRGGKPLAELRRVNARDFPPRPSGLCKGEFSVPDDFDAPLPDDILNEFEDHKKL